MGDDGVESCSVSAVSEKDLLIALIDESPVALTRSELRACYEEKYGSISKSRFLGIVSELKCYENGRMHALNRWNLCKEYKPLRLPYDLKNNELLFTNRSQVENWLRANNCI